MNANVHVLFPLARQFSKYLITQVEMRCVRIMFSLIFGRVPVPASQIELRWRTDTGRRIDSLLTPKSTGRSQTSVA